MKDEKELSGFIVLHRQILNWEWFDDAKTLQLFIYLLVSASFRDATWHGEKIKRGDVITSINKLSQILTVSERSIRTSLNHLKSTGEVTSRATSKYSVITVVNYGKYQDKSERPTSKPTNTVTGDRQASDRQATGNRQHRNNVNNVNNVNKRESAPAPVYFFGFYENVKLTEIEMEKFQAEYPKQWEATLERLSSYLAETGKTYSSHFAKLRAWAKEDSERAKAEPKPEGPKYRILE